MRKSLPAAIKAGEKEDKKMVENSTVSTASEIGKGTTARLFPEFEESATPPAGNATEPKKEIIAGEVQSEGTPGLPPDSKYLDIQKFGDAIIKTKVDGVELDVPVKDVVKAYQTDRYLTQKGQKIAEEARRIATKEKEQTTNLLPEEKIIEEDALYTEIVKPHTEQLSKQILSLSDEIKQMRENEKILAMELAPIRYEKAMSAIDSQLKKEGLTDFRQKLPEIERIMLSMPPEKMVEFDNPAGFENLYKRLKLSEMVQKEKTSVIPPVLPKKEAQNIVPVESSSSPSNADTSGNDRTKEFAKAKKTGDWTNFMMKYG